MTSYWKFWKRGWWAWLLLFSFNLTFGGVLYLLAVAFGKTSNLYLLLAAAAWLTFGAPLCGWLFEYFASNSTRLKAASATDSPAA